MRPLFQLLQFFSKLCIVRLDVQSFSKHKGLVSLRKIAILSSGGDCGGLNAVIKGAASAALHSKIEPYLIPNGYAGLYNLVDFSELVLLNTKRLDLFPVYMAGSEAGNSRVKISKIKDEDKYKRIRRGLEKFQIEALVIAGGDDTGSVAVDLSEAGIPCVHVPKTMDLDLMPYSVGGDSTINRIADFARDLRTTAQTHNRIMIVEVFGRYAGHTAFRGGIGAGADLILIPEIEVDLDLVYEQSKSLLERRISQSDNRAGMALIVVAEGIRDASGAEIVDKDAPPDSFGHRPLIGAAKYLLKELQKRLQEDESAKECMRSTQQFVAGIHEFPEVREVRPGHLVRCGFSSVIDISFGLEVGAGAVELIKSGIFGVSLVSYREGHLEYMDCKDAIRQRHVDLADVALYESLGFCFGRKPQNPQAKLKKIKEAPRRPH